jgi:hypothetical protein
MVTINLNTMVAALDLVRSLADRNLPFHVRTKMNNADSNTPQGIVATAISAITNDFHSLNRIAWYSAACFILVGVTSATWGKLFIYFPAKNHLHKRSCPIPDRERHRRRSKLRELPGTFLLAYLLPICQMRLGHHERCLHPSLHVLLHVGLDNQRYLNPKDETPHRR